MNTEEADELREVLEFFVGEDTVVLLRSNQDVEPVDSNGSG